MEDAMRKKKYEYLKEKYPEFVSLDQMYQICGIAKRTALYLIRKGIVPARDNGQRTWRYKIALDAVITYLRQREQWGSMVPPGAVSSRYKHKDTRPARQIPRRSYAEILRIGSEEEYLEYFTYLYSEYPDIVTASEAAEMTGMSVKAINGLISSGDIKAFLYNKRNLIPKANLLGYVSSRKYCESRCNTEQFVKVLGAFEFWLKSRDGHE